MKAIYLTAIITILILTTACVPSAEELAGINKTAQNKAIQEEKTPEPEVEVKQEITIMPDAQDNITTTEPETKENNTTNVTNKITTAAPTPPPQIAGNTIVYSGGAIEMGEGEKANIIIK